MTIKLQIHPQSKNKNIEVYVDYSLSLETLKVNFTINNYLESYCSKEFSKEAFKNWGLWNYDVVEVFFRPVNEQEYMELQVSPLNQQFQLAIIKPRITYYTPIDYRFSSKVEIVSNKLFVQIDIPNPWNTLDIEGNFFAILGSDVTRSYLAANLDDTKAPDFHRPDLFRKL